MTEQFDSISSHVPDVEILYVDNSESNEECSHPNVTHLNKGKKNIFVNPSWNLGASKAKFDTLLIFQDDIDINWDIVPNVNKFISPHVGMAGTPRQNTMLNPDNVVPKETPADLHVSFILDRNEGYSYAFFIHKESYEPIPEDLKIFWGDEYIFRKNHKRNVVLHDLHVTGEKSQSSRSPEFEAIAENDSHLFKTEPKLPYGRNMKDISLLVGTCDDYEFLWDNFKTLADRYLPFQNSAKVAFTESKEFGDGYITSHQGEDSIWSNRLIKALDKIESEFVFFVLEDYYFTSKITQEDLQSIMAVCQANSLDKWTFHIKTDQLRMKYDVGGMQQCTGMEGKHYIQDKFSMYLTTLQPGLWRTSYLKKCLQPDWTPWDFEIKGSERMAQLHAQLPQLPESDNAEPYGSRNLVYMLESPIYFNAVRQGAKISPGWEEVRDRENLMELTPPN